MKVSSAQGQDAKAGCSAVDEDDAAAAAAADSSTFVVDA